MATPKTIDLKECTIKFIDGTPTTPNTLTIKVDDGNLTWTRLREVDPKKDRGKLDYLKQGDEQNMKVSIDLRWDTLKASSGDPVTPFDFLEKQNGASAYLSTSGLCEVDTIDIAVYVDHACGTTVEDEIITFSKFAFQEIGGDLKGGKLSVSGICNSIKPTSVRTTLP